MATFAVIRIAIIIIVVIAVVFAVVGVLFALGIFNSPTNNFRGLCLPAPGFLCQNAILDQNGNLSFTLSQSTGFPIHNVAVGCTAAPISSTGLPNPPDSIIYLTRNENGTAVPYGIVAGTVVTGALSLLSGQMVPVSGLKCFNSDAVPLRSPAIGTEFSGSLYLNYTQNSSAPGPLNPILTQKFATLNLKVT